MINRKISVHLQNFPDTSFLDDEKDLVANMDFVRAICSVALSLRDNKNLRVRLPLQELKIIGKNASRVNNFKEIIAEEVNVKNVTIEEKIDGLAELKLQINFKKIGAKYGSKVKAITDAMRKGEWQKIAENAIEIAGVKLVDDEFEIKLMTNIQDDKKFAIASLPTNDCLVQLNIEVTQELEEEGIARDVIRAIQQSRKDANLNVASHIKLQISSENKTILQVIEKFAQYISTQVLATEIKAVENITNAQFSFKNKIEDGEITVGINL